MAQLKQVPLDELNRMNARTMMEGLGIRFTRLGPDFIEATMPVDPRTHQVHGILHGGASVALAETLGSVGSALCVAEQGRDPAVHRSVGVEINANHVKSVASGTVTGTARPLHVGRSTQVWDIRITDEQGALVCVSRLTVAVVSQKS